MLVQPKMEFMLRTNALQQFATVAAMATAIKKASVEQQIDMSTHICREIEET